MKDGKGKLKYFGLICGGIGDQVWDKEVEVTADSFLEAVQKVYANKPYDSDLVSLEQEA